jgi:hypothetical protein
MSRSRHLGKEGGVSDSQLCVPIAGYLTPLNQPLSEKRATFSGGLCRTRAGNRPAEEGARLSREPRQDHLSNLIRRVAFRHALRSQPKREFFDTP